jgi:hypothetical protein
VALALAIAVFALPTWLAVTRYAAVDQSHNQRARDLWQPILATPLPRGSVLLSNDRDDMVPLLYYQYVEGQRPDLLELYPQILPGPDWSNIGRVTEMALGSQRPVYLVKPMPGLEVKFRLEPAGSV